MWLEIPVVVEMTGKFHNNNNTKFKRIYLGIRMQVYYGAKFFSSANFTKALNNCVKVHPEKWRKNG